LPLEAFLLYSSWCCIFRIKTCLHTHFGLLEWSLQGRRRSSNDGVWFAPGKVTEFISFSFGSGAGISLCSIGPAFCQMTPCRVEITGVSGLL
jgi:hypothetical protein